MLADPCAAPFQLHIGVFPRNNILVSTLGSVHYEASSFFAMRVQKPESIIASTCSRTQQIRPFLVEQNLTFCSCKTIEWPFDEGEQRLLIVRSYKNPVGS